MELSRQEIFDKVAKHLLGQMQKSQLNIGIDGESVTICAYRGRDGLKCAIGVLIPDEKYDPIMEDAAIPLGAIGVDPFDVDTIYMLENLQSVHDTCQPEEWKDRLMAVGKAFGLSLQAIP